MAAKPNAVDSARFQGQGINFKAKLIGIEEVTEARGDQMCQIAITKLKNSVKISGEHKQKVFVNVTLEGLKIIDAISLASNQNKKKNDNRNSKSNGEIEETEKSQESLVLHSHEVHHISFISRDVTDNRAFGYVYGGGDGKHQFFALKTAAAAEQLVLTLRDLFQVVYEMKKQEVDEAKLKIEENNTTEKETADEGNRNSPGNGSTSGIGQAQNQNQIADAEGIYQVPPNNAPVNPASQQQQFANLLDLEDQADQILKGIEQIKNLEFDSLTNDSSDMSSPTSPVSPASNTDPWGAPPAPAASAGTASSDLASLQGFNTTPFGGLSMPFPGSTFAQSQPMPGMRMPIGGLPVSKDPFGNDPFASQFQQGGVRPTAFPTTVGAPTFGGASLFGGPRMMGQSFPAAPQPFPGAPQPGMAMPGAAMGGQPFPGAPQPGMAMPGAAMSAQPFPGAPQPGMAMPGVAMMGLPGMPRGIPQPISGGAGAANPFSNAFGESDPNVLMPIRNQQEELAAAAPEKSSSLHDNLFGDLVGMKKSVTNAVSPRDMFAQIKVPEKKSMNDLKSAKPGSPEATAQASFPDGDPFGETNSFFNDRTRGLVGESGDPFDTSHIPALPAVPPSKSSLLSPHQSVVITPASSSLSSKAPPVPQRQTLQNSNVLITKECSLSLSASSSSSSTLSPPPPSDPMPFITPPPLPVRRKEIKPSTLPSIPTCLPLKEMSTPVNMSFPNDFMLPSPDEPPPPLPENLMSTPAAPPPPPRPAATLHIRSSSLNGPINNNVNNNQQQLNLTNVSSPDSSSPFSSRAKTGSHLANTHSFHHSNSLPAAQNDAFQSGHSHSIPDPFNISLKSFSNNNLTSPNSSSGISSDSSSSLSDPFSSQTPEKLVKSPKLTGRLNTPLDKDAEEQDPFGIPLHLTPGFKAVAKFGSDPFEDSFHAGLSESHDQDKWDPFAENVTQSVSGCQISNDPWNPAFGDAFAPPAVQPVNGNTSGNSLMD